MLALREAGYETIMVNSNPETVSTDFDISDKLYFEPLTLEDVLEIVQREQPLGVIVQLGGQTPIKLTRALERAGVTILGTSPDAIDIAEDRRRFDKVARASSASGSRPTARRRRVAEAEAVALEVGYPGARAPVVRARRTRDADRVRSGVAARLLRDARRACPRIARCSSIAFSRMRTRWMSTRSATATS